MRVDATPWISTFHWYTGQGLAMELLCESCSVSREGGGVIVADSLCIGCFRRLNESVVTKAGVRGSPEIRENLHSINERIKDQHIKGLGAPLLDLAQASESGEWFGLCSDNTIVAIAPDWTSSVLTSFDISPPTDREPRAGNNPRLRLHASSTGRYLAVVVDFAEVGVVIDVINKAVTMRLDNGGSDSWTVPFPIGFTTMGDREVLVHQTEWNRLDISDPASGALLTERAPTGYGQGEDPPAHYLDYFHGQLRVSPDGKRAVDDGWVWHPIGVPVVWSLERWHNVNPWESEDGSSRRTLGSRVYYWNHGICWLDDDRVAVEGIGDDDRDMVAGVVVYDVNTETEGSEVTSRPPPEIRSSWITANEVTAFAGPRGELFGHGNSLFSVSGEGLSVWAVDTGTRIGFLPAFTPQHHDRSNCRLIELNDHSVRIWNYATEPTDGATAENPR